MKHIFIINTFSIQAKQKDVVKNIEKICILKKIDYSIEFVTDEINTDDILSKYANEQNIIFGVGGDGTINRIVNKLVGTKNILGIIPMGTGNDFYKTINEIENGEETLKKVDVARINNQYFINVACFGIDADVANNIDRFKRKWIPKSQRYNMSLLYTFLKYKNKELTFSYNQNEEKGKFATIAVCNARYYGGGYKIAPNANYSDGILNICYAEDIPKRYFPKLILKMKKGKHENSSFIKIAKTNKIRIVSKNEIVCNFDGESMKDTIFEIEIIKEGITIYNNKHLVFDFMNVKGD